MDEFHEKWSRTEAELRAGGRSPTPHAKRVMTCRNHPDLRWATKREFGRSIFFLGRAFDPPRYHTDFSGPVCEDLGVSECPCPGTDLVTAPEDRVMNPDLYKGES